MTSFHALIPCAGTGSRAGTALPKQYQPVAGQPMVMHTLQALARVPQLATGDVQLTEGTPEQLRAFLACFEPPAERMPLLATR